MSNILQNSQSQLDAVKNGVLDGFADATMQSHDANMYVQDKALSRWVQQTYHKQRDPQVEEAVRSKVSASQAVYALMAALPEYIDYWVDQYPPEQQRHPLIPVMLVARMLARWQETFEPTPSDWLNFRMLTSSSTATQHEAQWAEMFDGEKMTLRSWVDQLGHSSPHEISMETLNTLRTHYHHSLKAPLRMWALVAQEWAGMMFPPASNVSAPGYTAEVQLDDFFHYYPKELSPEVRMDTLRMALNTIRVRMGDVQRDTCSTEPRTSLYKPDSLAAVPSEEACMMAMKTGDFDIYPSEFFTNFAWDIAWPQGDYLDRQDGWNFWIAHWSVAYANHWVAQAYDEHLDVAQKVERTKIAQHIQQALVHVFSPTKWPGIADMDQEQKARMWAWVTKTAPVYQWRELATNMGLGSTAVDALAQSNYPVSFWVQAPYEDRLAGAKEWLPTQMVDIQDDIDLAQSLLR